MNILIFTTYYPYKNDNTPENTTKAIHYFAREWVKEGHNVLVIHNYIQKPKIFELLSFFKKGKNYRKEHLEESQQTIEGVNSYLLPINRYIPRRNFFFKKDLKKQKRKIIEILNDNDFTPDALITHFCVAQIQIVKSLKKQLSCTRVGVFHKSDINYLKRIYKKKKVRDLLNIYHKFGFRSNSIMDDVVDMTGKSGFLVQSGVPDYIMENQDDTTSNIVNRTRKPIKLLYAGRLQKSKNIDKTLEALAILKEEYEIEFSIIGTGPLEEILKDKVKILNLQKNVNFLGVMEREEVLEEMFKNDYFIMVSSPETFGISYIEAMGCGCISIGAVGEGIDGVITDGKNGFLVKPNDSSHLVSTLRKAITMNEQQFHSILKNSKKTALQYTEAKVAEKYLREITLL